MRDFIELDSVPDDEEPGKLSDARTEASLLILQLKRTHGAPPPGVQYKISARPHDLGSYYSIYVYFDDEDQEAVSYVNRLKSPSTWDDISHRQAIRSFWPDRGTMTESTHWHVGGIARLITEHPDIMESDRDFRNRYQSMPIQQKIDSTDLYRHMADKSPALKTFLLGFSTKDVIDMMNTMCAKGVLKCEFIEGANRPVIDHDNIHKVKEQLIASSMRGETSPKYYPSQSS